MMPYRKVAQKIEMLAAEFAQIVHRETMSSTFASGRSES